jgi:dolichyl-phosphate-mannose--protein O-mannosyl transferase
MLDGGRWEFGKSAYLIHVNTGATLHSHGNAEHHLTRGEFEVTGYKDKPGDYDEWIAVRPLKRFVLMDANPFKRLRSFFSRTSP